MKRNPKESFEEYKKRRKAAKIIVKKKLKGTLNPSSVVTIRGGKKLPYRKDKKATS